MVEYYVDSGLLCADAVSRYCIVLVLANLVIDVCLMIWLYVFVSDIIVVCLFRYAALIFGK